MSHSLASSLINATEYFVGVHIFKTRFAPSLLNSSSCSYVSPPCSVFSVPRWFYWPSCWAAETNSSFKIFWTVQNLF